MKPQTGTIRLDREQPWPGLSTFTEEQRAFFHGRDHESRELVRRLTRKTLTVLFAQSGLGKSSLLQAGVFPLLREAGFCPIYLRLDHGADAVPIVEQIKPAVLRETSLMGTWSQPGIATAGETLWEFFHHRDDVLRGAAGQLLTPVLVFDQFEEVFTLGSASEAARARVQTFLAGLAELVENHPPASFQARLEAGTLDPETFDFARSDYRVLIALREDYLPDLEGLKTAMPALMHSRFRLTRLTGLQAIEAVKRPAPDLVTDEVARALVAFVSGRTDLEAAEVEPALLSLVCSELNLRRRAVRADAIDAALLEGSRDTILAEFYERTLADQLPAVRYFVEEELLTDSGFRENITLERAQKLLAAAGAPPAALDSLVARRLLRIEERLDVRRVELTHDVLCGVVRASRDARRAREAAAAGERRRLETEAALAASVQRESEARRAVIKARAIAAGCAVLAAAAVAATIFGYLNFRRARTAETAAVQSAAAAELTRTQAEHIVNFLADDLSEELGQMGRMAILDRLMSEVLRYYEHLPKSQRTADTEASYAVALARSASIISGARGRSSHAEMMRRLEAASGVVAALGGAPPAASLEIAKAEVLIQRGGASDGDGRFSEELELSRQAVGIVDRALKQFPDSSELRLQQGRAYYFFGYAQIRLGDPAAIATLERAAEMARQLPRPTPEAGFRNDNWRARALGWAAYSADRVGRFAEIERLAPLARKSLDEVLARDPSNGPASNLMAQILRVIGEVELLHGHADRAVALDAEARDQLERRVAVNPRLGTPNNNLLVHNVSSARMFVQLGELRKAAEILPESDSVRFLTETGTGFVEANLLNFRLTRAELAAARGDQAAVNTELSEIRRLSRNVTAAQKPGSTDRIYREERLASAEREIALARGDYAAVAQSARASLARFAAARPEGGDRAPYRQQQTRQAAESLARAAAEKGDWTEAEDAWRQALALLHQPNADGGEPVEVLPAGSVSLINIAVTPQQREADYRAAFAWSLVQQGKTAEAISEAGQAREFLKHRLAEAGATDLGASLSLALADVALARARIAARGDPTEIRGELAEAEATLATMPTEFRATTWVRQIQVKFDQTRALAN